MALVSLTETRFSPYVLMISTAARISSADAGGGLLRMSVSHAHLAENRDFGNSDIATCFMVCHVDLYESLGTENHQGSEMVLAPPVVGWLSLCAFADDDQNLCLLTLLSDSSFAMTADACGSITDARTSQLCFSSERDFLSVISCPPFRTRVEWWITLRNAFSPWLGVANVIMRSSVSTCAGDVYMRTTSSAQREYDSFLSSSASDFLMSSSIFVRHRVQKLAICST